MPNRCKSGKVGVVFAMRQEERGLERALSGSRLARRGDGKAAWLVGNTEVMAAVGGVGGDRAAAAADALIAGGAQWIVCAGFAAGLDPDIAAGDVLVASRVVRRDSSPAIECSAGLIQAAPPDGSFKFGIRRGDLVTVDTVVCGASEKADAREATGAWALDMESYAAADVCRSRGVPFAAVRSITDTADETLPEAVAALAGIEGTVGRIAFALGHPRLWPALPALRSRGIAAADNLGDVLGIILLRLI